MVVVLDGAGEDHRQIMRETGRQPDAAFGVFDTV